MYYRTYLQRLALGIAVLAGLPALAANPNTAQNSEQCSVAVFGQSAADSRDVCNPETPKKLSKDSTVFQQNQDGIVSMLAIGPNRSVKEAVAWLRKAAQRGNAAAQVNLGVMYSNGWGVPRNDATALHWLVTAADAGSARALYNLGIMYMQGQGVRQDYAKALKFFQQAAESCDTGAQTNLAYLYDRGLGVKADPKLAAEWYQRAADKGEALAQHNLGDMYLRGDGVARDDVKALKLFAQAAAQGHTGAQIKLGYMLSEGRGTKRDPESAYRWIHVASVAGDKRGDYLLPSIKAQLTTDQMRRAEMAEGVQVRQESTEPFLRLASLQTNDKVSHACSLK